MTSPSDLTEIMIRDHLDSGGFLGPFTDILGGSQPAPLTQIGIFRDTDTESTSRIVLIRSDNAGGPSDDIYRIENMIISFIGLGNYDDWLITKGRATQAHRWLLENFKSDCIINFDDISDVTGPYFTESDRPVAEMNFTLTLEA